MNPYIAELVRREDRDRYLTALFIPEPARARVLALYAFNSEVAKIRESVSETLVGAMKLQWWRDLIAAIYAGENPPKGNPVVEALAGAIADCALSRSYFDALLEARGRDLDENPPENVNDLEVYAEGTSAALIWLVLEVLGVRDDASRAAARHVGIAWALTGMLRAVLFHARVNRFLLPSDLMTAAALTAYDLKERRNSAKIAGIVAEIARIARLHLDKARALRASVDRSALPALLPATLADAYLRGFARYGFDVFDPRHGLQRPAVARLIWNAALKRY